MAKGAGSGTARRVLVVVVLAVAVAAFLAVAAERHGFFDLQVYYGAINYWANDGGHLYDWIRVNTLYGFTYPPFAALVMLPMALVSWPVAIVVSVTASAAATLLLLWWLIDPVARRQGWTRWFALAVVACLAAAFEPLRETVNFGQVNMLLLILVAADLVLLTSRGSRWAGVGIGLATAIKLTPGLFIVYLLVTGRWRAALTASGTATLVTLVAAALFPDASREFWTQALWNTDRVGVLSFVSNQSLQGIVARLDPVHPSRALWLVLVAVVVAYWVWRVRAAVARGDEMTGLALTGIVTCLVSPVTWVHHLVWLIPALLLLVDNGLAAPAGSRRRRALLGLAAVSYGLLISRLVWQWQVDFSGVDGFLGSNAYAWISLVLLFALPIRDRSAGADRAGVADLGEDVRGETAGAGDPVDAARPVGR
ncbi:glycosyltransferase 87 family protein [Polymorphospora sp. NPDC050346]|uniref:glycosyltransferase 87 family protein n=1 Tax=Polymorphospora sp. NPDC050346 TaxID=3155780 RepID=UPI0033CEA0A6